MDINNNQFEYINPLVIQPRTNQSKEYRYNCVLNDTIISQHSMYCLNEIIFLTILDIKNTKNYWNDLNNLSIIQNVRYIPC